MKKAPEHVAMILDAGPVDGSGPRDGKDFAERLAVARALCTFASDSGVRYLTLCQETIAGTLDAAAQDRLLRELRPELDASERRGLTVRIPLSSGRADLALVTRKLAEQVRSGALSPDDISLELLQQHLAGAALPDPDLIILCGRAPALDSGEPRPQRLSGCLLFDSAYAEFHFCETTFPTFTATDWHRALSDFSQRDRRFGRTPEPVPQPTTRFTSAALP